ncbi:MAG: hypothetical protein U9P14_07485 [Gemmatimonadota bacterium]|nr:hypothetical protein [Gemmatimonadota bacterium]
MNNYPGRPYSPRISRLITGIEDDCIHGAGYLASRCLDILVSGAKELAGHGPAKNPLEKYLKTLAGDLAEAQGAMCVIENLLAVTLERFFSQAAPKPLASTENIRLLVKIIEEEKIRFEQELTVLAQNGASFLLKEYSPGMHIVTISYSRAVIEVLKELAAAGIVKKLEVTAAESRPLGEGVQLAAELAGLGLSVRLVADCLLGMETKGADVVLIGADSITPGGDVVNKAGTRLLALAARADGLGVFCCAQTAKIMAANSEPGKPFPIQQQRPGTELVDLMPEGVEVLNLYFDLTEKELISGYITEKGIVTRETLREISAETSRMVLENIRL